MTMGLVVEASIPNHLRWLPMGMDVNYVKKATGSLTATSTIDPTAFFTLSKYPGKVLVPVQVVNSEGIVVTTADVSDYISLIRDSTYIAYIICIQLMKHTILAPR